MGLGASAMQTWLTSKNGATLTGPTRKCICKQSVNTDETSSQKLKQTRQTRCSKVISQETFQAILGKLFAQRQKKSQSEQLPVASAMPKTS